MELADLRDLILVIAIAGLGVVALGCLILVLVAGRIGWRVIRRAQRLHDERVSVFIERLDGWIERATRADGSVDWSFLRPLAQRAFDRVRGRRKPKKRRLWGLLPPAG